MRQPKLTHEKRTALIAAKQFHTYKYHYKYAKTEYAFLPKKNLKKLVATVSRCERVYKRTGEPSVTF